MILQKMQEAILLAIDLRNMLGKVWSWWTTIFVREGFRCFYLRLTSVINDSISGS